MTSLIYVTLEQALQTYENTIRISGGGSAGCLNTGRLESVLQNIKNDDWYPTFEDKLTHLFFSVCRFHCFTDGNKRIALTLSLQFLLFNGYLAVAREFLVDMENISYQVAAGNIDKDLLLRIIVAKLDGTYELDEELKLELINVEK